MAIYYVDLDVSSVTESDGSSPVTPWSAVDWQTWAAANTSQTGHTFNFKGSHDFGSAEVLFQENGNCTFQAWDLVLYGPWRISCGTIRANSGSQNGNVISGAIIRQVSANSYGIPNSRNSYYISNDVSIGSGISIYGCLLNASGNLSGSSFDGNVFQDSVIAASTFGSTSYAVIFNNCAMTGTHASYTLSNCQTDWVAPSLPAWDADRSAFESSVLFANVNTPPQPGNSPYTNYTTDLWGNTRTGIGTGDMLVVDVTAPSWIATYPKVNAITATTAVFDVEIDEDGTGYFVVVPNNATAPTSAQVKAGTDSNDTAVATGFSGNVELLANVENMLTASNLTSQTNYDVYFVAEDSLMNLQASPIKLDVLTSDVTAPSWITTYPKVNAIAATTVTFAVEINENGTGYFVVVPNNAVAPSSVQVKAGQNSSNVAVANGFSGNVSLLANVQNILTASNLISQTNYDVYFVAEDSLNNLQASPVKLDVLTSDITAPLWSATYPKNGVQTTTTATILISVNESSTVYGIALLRGSAAPTSAQVKAGTNASNVAVSVGLSDSVIVSSNVESSIEFSNLLVNGDYDAYLVVEDASNNLQSSPVKVKFTTLPLIVSQRGVPQAQSGQIITLQIASLNILTTKDLSIFKMAVLPGEGYSIVQLGEREVQIKMTSVDYDNAVDVNVRVGDGIVASDIFLYKVKIVKISSQKERPVSYGGTNINPPTRRSYSSI